MDLFSYLLGKKAGGGGVTPTGTINITQNGETDVTNYATANVAVPEPTGTIPITENGIVDVTNFASANVNVPTGGTLKISSGSSSIPGYMNMISTIPTLEIEGTSCAYMFSNYKQTTIPQLLGTSNVTNMEGMFTDSPNITNYNLGNYDTSNVTNMSYMFYNSSNPAVKSLDLSNFNTSKVTDMTFMFYNLNKLATLDISNFDFSIVSTSSLMFRDCGKSCLQTDGAYANGIPYVYVKDATAQNWVLTASNGHPSTWTTANVVIKS